MTSVPTPSPARIRKYTRCPRFVKTRNCTGLDKPPGTAYVSGYAIRGRGVVTVYHTMAPCSSPTEGGIVQNMPSEARVEFMGSFRPKDYTRSPDYFTDNTGRLNLLGNQSQDNCMLSRSSQRMVPSSIGLGG